MGMTSTKGNLFACGSVSKAKQAKRLPSSSKRINVCEVDDGTSTNDSEGNRNDNLLNFHEGKLSLNMFDKLKTIGKGTFGKVILVKSRIDGKLYALKCMKKAHIIKTGQLDNIKTERNILDKVQHPFIIKLQFTFQTEDKIFIGLDYHNGGELFFHLCRFKRFTEDMVRFYLAEVYVVLSFLHRQNIVYRDLKPENIILDAEGHIKLIDFGLAKENMGEGEYTNIFCGTNEYIPPEVIEGKEYNRNFDWWGFGVLMYELLYGQPPFKHHDKRFLFRMILQTEPDYGKVHVSSEALDLMKGLLAKDPKKRIRPSMIPKHKFFSGVNFYDVMNKKYTPAIIPKINSIHDLNYIDPCFLRESVNSPVKNVKINFDQSN